MSSSFLRKIQTLQLIPKHPSRISSTQILNTLKRNGFEVEIRQLQRDLNTLSQLFDIESDGNKDIPGWYWKADAEKLELPRMELPVALSFQLTQQYLDKIFPKGALQHLTPYFKLSNNLLNSTDSSLSKWPNKVAIIPRNQPLIPPSIPDNVLNAAYLSLLTDTEVTATYTPVLKQASPYQLAPRALVIVEQMIYLVAKNLNTNKISQYALHRFSEMENTNTPINTDDNFDLQTYLKAGNFEYPVPTESTIKLKLLVTEKVAYHLEESKLSLDQIITPAEDDEYEIAATVKNTQQLRWWILSYGDYVEVLEPESLRDEFAETADILYHIYHHNN